MKPRSTRVSEESPPTSMSCPHPTPSPCTLYLSTADPDYHVTQGEVVRLVWFATNDPTQPWVEARVAVDVR